MATTKENRPALKRKSTRRNASEPTVDVSALQRVVIQCVDPGECSSESRLDQGVIGSASEADIVKNPGYPSQVCGAAIARARELDVPALMLIEKPFQGAAQGHYIGLWTNAWMRAGGKMSGVLKIHPGAWRSPALGKQWVSAPKINGVRKYKKRDEIKAEA